MRLSCVEKFEIAVFIVFTELGSKSERLSK